MKRGVWIALVVMMLSLVISKAQGNLTVSGTVYAAPGSSLQGTVIVACLVENDTCSDSRSGVQQINAGASSAAFQIGNLESAEYLMIAWCDLNGNGDADAGDELGVYQQNAKPALIRPPAENLELRLQAFNGNLDALVAQADVVTPQPITPSPVTPQVVTPQPMTPAPTSSGLNFSGRVVAQAGSSLSGAQVFAAIFLNDTLDPKRTKGARVDANGGFSITGLEKLKYSLFAWRDTNTDGKIGLGDEIGVYTAAGKPTLLTPPMNNLSLPLQPFSNAAFDAMRDLFLPAKPASTTPSANPPVNTALKFSIPANWKYLGGTEYSVEFGKEDSSYKKGTLYVGIFPTRAKQGSLLAQTRAIWKTETKGSLDLKGKEGGLFVRRLPSGLNVGVTSGTIGRYEEDSKKDPYYIIGQYSVLFVVEHGTTVTPIFFKMIRAHTSPVYFTYENEGRPLMLDFMNKLKPAQAVKVPPLYTEKDFIGKWKVTSSTYNSTDWYSSNGVYSTSTWVATGFTLKLSFKTGGTGTYYASLTTVNTGVFNTQTEDEKSKWRITGDQIIIDRPSSGRKAVYQLYGIGKDAKGKPLILSKYLVNPDKQPVADLDSSPEDIWTVDQ